MSTSSLSVVTSQLPCLSLKSRQRLCERCQVALAITATSYRDWNKVHDCNCELILIFEAEEEETQDDEEYNTPPPSPTPSLVEETHLVEIIDGLYIALADDEADVRALRTFDDEPFTHVVQVNYVTPPEDMPFSLSDWRREETSRNALVQRLSLFCPASSLRLSPEQTAVGPKELLAARDFLTLALPGGSTKWWPEELRKDERGEPCGEEKYDVSRELDEGEVDGKARYVYLAPDLGLDAILNEEADLLEDENVNVLIVAPTSRAVDVLSVLFCYLAFLEDTTIKRVADMDYFDEVWQNVVLGPWSMQFVELIAKCD